jgi:hypothetical protein
MDQQIQDRYGLRRSERRGRPQINELFHLPEFLKKLARDATKAPLGTDSRG